MDNATIVAAVILVGVFVIMLVTLIKYGVKGAIQIWSVMGTLTGLAFGGITSFYFTNKSNQQEIQQANLQRKVAMLALDNAARKAADANEFVGLFATVLKGESKPLAYFPLDANTISSIPKKERSDLADKMTDISADLKVISALKEKITQEKRPLENK